MGWRSVFPGKWSHATLALEIAGNGRRMTPEAKAGQTINALLMPAGWHVCNVLDMSIYAGSRVAEPQQPLAR